MPKIEIEYEKPNLSTLRRQFEQSAIVSADETEIRVGGYTAKKLPVTAAPEPRKEGLLSRWRSFVGLDDPEVFSATFGNTIFKLVQESPSLLSSLRISRASKEDPAKLAARFNFTNAWHVTCPGRDETLIFNSLSRQVIIEGLAKEAAKNAPEAKEQLKAMIRAKLERKLDQL